MKVLQLCKKVPLPPKDGEAVAVLAMANAYKKQGARVDLLSFNTSKHFVSEEEIQSSIHPYSSINTVYLDTSINRVKAFLNLFSRRSFNIERFVSREFIQKLIQQIADNDYDFIQLESLYMTPYLSHIRNHSRAPVIMRSHNVEYRIWEDMSKQNDNIFLKWYYLLCAKRLKNYEKDHLDYYDLIFAISSSDKVMIENLKPMVSEKLMCVPVGLDLSMYRFLAFSERKIIRFGYLGSLDWKPNIEGLLWFFNSVWKDISELHDNIEFHLAGRNPVESIRNLQLPKLHYHGEVESAYDYLADLDIVVVPLFSGSGIRIKILESMAMGRPVISTPKGFEGIDIQNGIHADIVSNKNEFINAIKAHIEDGDRKLEMAVRARRFIEENFSFTQIAGKALNRIMYLTEKESNKNEKI